jgi:hypothetical protein
MLQRIPGLFNKVYIFGLPKVFQGRRKRDRGWEKMKQSRRQAIKAERNYRMKTELGRKG